MAELTEAGNEILTALKTYSDWDGVVGTAPETITIGTKLEGHPLGWLDDVETWPGLFLVPLAWPANQTVAKQYQHTFSVAIYLVVEWVADTQPYQQARTELMKVRRNLVGAKALTTHILGLSYLAEERWRNATPENEFSRFLREAGLPYGCASMALDYVAWSEVSDTD